MEYGIYIVIGLIIVLIGIFFAYRADFKQDKKGFRDGISSISKAILFILLFFALIKGSEYLIPFHKNHGIEFNVEREELGIPLLQEDWELNRSESGQFSSYWWAPEPRSGHFKKVIEYNIIGAKSETDYYLNNKKESTFAWSIYDFKSGSFEYFLEKPQEETISLTAKQHQKSEILKIDKDEFEAYLTK